MALAYTIWFGEDSRNDYMWSLGAEEAAQREDANNLPALFAPLVRNGVRHAFTLLKKNAPKVSSPERKRDIVKFLGADGDVDLLENITDTPLFERRTIEETFLLLGEHAQAGNYYLADRAEWSALISEIKNFLNTRTGEVKIVLGDDRAYYYQGRISAEIEELEEYRAIVRVKANCQPYKYERYSSAEPWMWDDFSFIDGIIRDYRNIAINNTTYVDLAIPVRSGDVHPIITRKSYTDGEIPQIAAAIKSNVEAFAGNLGQLATRSLAYSLRTIIPSMAGPVMTQEVYTELAGYFDNAATALDALDEIYGNPAIAEMLPDDFAVTLTEMIADVGTKTDAAETKSIGSFVKMFGDAVTAYNQQGATTTEQNAAVASARIALLSLSGYSSFSAQELLISLDKISVCTGDPTDPSQWVLVESGKTSPDFVVKGSNAPRTVRHVYIKGASGTVSVDYRGKTL